MDTCPRCGQALPAPPAAATPIPETASPASERASKVTIWVDEELLGLCNAAHAEAARTGTAHVEIAHLLLVIAQSERQASCLGSAGLEPASLARVARQGIILADRRAEGAVPRTSEALRALLQRATETADAEGQTCAGVEHLIDVLPELCCEVEGLADLLAPARGSDDRRTEIAMWTSGAQAPAAGPVPVGEPGRPAADRLDGEAPTRTVAEQQSAAAQVRTGRSVGFAKLEQARAAAAGRFLLDDDAAGGSDRSEPITPERAPGGGQGHGDPVAAGRGGAADPIAVIIRRLDAMESVLASLLVREPIGAAATHAAQARHENGELRRQWRLRRIGPFGPLEAAAPSERLRPAEPPVAPRPPAAAAEQRDQPGPALRADIHPPTGHDLRITPALAMAAPPPPPRTLEPVEDIDEPADDGDEKRFYLAVDDPIVRAPSIGPKTAARLAPFGIHRVGQLLAADPARLAGRLGVEYITPRRVAEWQAQARLVCTVPWLRGTHAQLLVGAGYDTVAKLRSAELATVCAAILRFASTRDGQSILRAGQPPDMERIGRWLDQARYAEPQRAA